MTEVTVFRRACALALALVCSAANALAQHEHHQAASDNAGRHPAGFQHPHIFSRVGALTGGYLHHIVDVPGGQLAIGGDIGGYRVPANLVATYGLPVSIHLFVMWKR